MADSCESESEEEQQQKALENLNESQRGSEKDLQTIFKKLRVDSDVRKFKTKSRFTAIRRKGSSISRKEIKVKKKIIKDATFVYKSCSPKKELKYLKTETQDLQLEQRSKLSNNETSKTQTINQKLASPTTKSPTNFSKSCSGQFRQAQSSKIPHGDVNFDDTTPEELAAYFEQLLHIPKPMSAMAEMMYT